MGKDFESRKQEYLERLRNNFELFERMRFNESNESIFLLAREMILDPKNEEELLFAIFALDFADLSVRAATGDVKPISIKDNIYVNLLVDVISSLKNGEDVKQMIEEAKMNPAKCLYDYVVGLVDDTDATIDYLAEKTNYDIYDEFEFAQFLLYLDKANSLINISDFGPKTSYEDIRFMREEFHRLCEEGRLENTLRRNNKNSR